MRQFVLYVRPEMQFVVVVMHGLIHLILKELIVEKFGLEKWQDILKRLGIENPTEKDADAGVIDPTKYYPDDLTVKAVVTTAEVLGVTFDDAMRVYGQYFVSYIHMGGHLRMLQSMGDNLADFMKNINHLHFNLERSMRKASFPTFQIDRMTPDGNEFRLSYASVRGAALYALVEGVLPALAKSLYRKHVDMTRCEDVREGFIVSWEVRSRPLPESVQESIRQTESKKTSPSSKSARATEKTYHPAAASWHFAVMSAFRCCVSLPIPSGGGDAKVAPVEGASSEYDAEKIGRELDELAKKLAAYTGKDTSLGHGNILMRSVRAGDVSCEWTALKDLDRVAAFWANFNIGDPRYFCMSKPSKRAMCFVSHAWSAPDDWHKKMGAKCHYGEVKATELAIVAKDCAEAWSARKIKGDSTIDWKDVTFWIDKCCIPQSHHLVPRYVNLIEEFLRQSDHLVVICSWHYFSRLWCVYEWAAFLVYHDFHNMHMCVDCFLRTSTTQSYVYAIKNVSVERSQCFDEKDRETLRNKVNEYYVSTDQFETFVRKSAIALMADCVIRMESRNHSLNESDLDPWINLANELGYEKVAKALNAAEPMQWRKCAMEDAAEAGDAKWQNRFGQKIDEWFSKHMNPVLVEVRKGAVRPSQLANVKIRKSKRYFTKRMSHFQAAGE
eukprot:g3966.t1